MPLAQNCQVGKRRSGLEAHSAVGQNPARRIEFSLRTGRSSPFAELCFGILGSGNTALGEFI